MSCAGLGLLGLDHEGLDLSPEIWRQELSSEDDLLHLLQTKQCEGVRHQVEDDPSILLCLPLEFQKCVQDDPGMVEGETFFRNDVIVYRSVIAYKLFFLFFVVFRTY